MGTALDGARVAKGTGRIGSRIMTRSRSVAPWTSICAAASFAVLVAGCHRKGGATESSSGASSGEAKPLPPLALKDDTPNALLTWVDDHGNFHVVEHTADVPDAG